VQAVTESMQSVMDWARSAASGYESILSKLSSGSSDSTGSSGSAGRIPTTGNAATDQWLKMHNAPDPREVYSLSNLQEQWVKNWYTSNPNADKNPGASDIQYWIDEINKNGQIGAQQEFAQSVADKTGTAPVSISDFNGGTDVAKQVQDAYNKKQEEILKALQAQNKNLEALLKVQSSGNSQLINNTSQANSTAEATRKSALLASAA
jgi:hypothetical protein